jgi:tetratricopeptide (TPR) repeat protein
VPVLMLAARVHAVDRDLAGAERSLKRVIELEPSSLQAYGMLGQLYLGQRRLDEARAEFERLARKQEKPVGARTMIAMINEMQGKRDEAIKEYERVVQIDPQAAVASNNLAWMYAEGGGNLDLALQLARTAKAQLPDSPEVSDTLGWVYYKKGMYREAVVSLEDTVSKVPTNPEYKARLGLAYVKAGQTDKGRQTLNDALKLKPDFPGADEARKALQGLGS